MLPFLRFHRPPCLFAAGLASLLLLGSGTAADEGGDELLSVLLQDGHRVHGELSARTDDDHLWITATDDGIVLSSAFPWSNVESVAAGEVGVTRYELIARAAAMRKALSPDEQLERRIGFWFPQQDMADRDDIGMGVCHVKPARYEPRATPGPVRFLEIDARPQNWDRDPELDGLLVLVQPTDEDGEVVPVNGQVRLQLLGQRYAGPIRRTFDSEIAFPTLGTWTYRLREDDFGPNGAVIRLPFRRLHPQFDTDLGAHALLTARLGVAGQGTFDASAADVFIRPSSRYCDELFLHSQPPSRFHPVEPTRRR